jgi:hypothetical protein
MTSDLKMDFSIKDKLNEVKVLEALFQIISQSAKKIQILKVKNNKNFHK